MSHHNNTPLSVLLADKPRRAPEPFLDPLFMGVNRQDRRHPLIVDEKHRMKRVNRVNPQSYMRVLPQTLNNAANRRKDVAKKLQELEALSRAEA